MPVAERSGQGMKCRSRYRRQPKAVRAVLATSQNGKLFVSWHRLMR
jgi:hypothetical protein